MTSAVRTTELTKRYGRRPALSDCTLDIPAGHVVGLVGPNGAGKSTLLQLACGLLTPSEGRVASSPRTPRSIAR
jgi:ABC-2 type transport system ATP-binding protein